MNSPQPVGSNTVKLSLEPEVVGSTAEDAKTYDSFATVNLNDDTPTNKGDVASAAAAKAGVAYFTGAARKGVTEFKTYIIENPNGLKTFGLLLGSLLLVFSLLGVINVFSIVHPLGYAVNLFNIFFAMTVVVIEGKESWGFFGLREKLFDNFKVLSYPSGRVAFYLYLGIMILCILPGGIWYPLYIILGTGFLICAVSQVYTLWQQYGKNTATTGSVRHIEFNDNDAMDNI